MNEIIRQKKILREILTKERKLIKIKATQEFNSEAFDELSRKIDLKKIDYVASFISIRSEISTNQLNEKIIDMKKKISFPIIEKNSEVLIFKTTNYNNKFELGKFNIPEPTSDNKKIIPQLFFVPCLGFDKNGYRIGYGGGFYDKTFARLKKLNLVFYTVGFAFDAQKQNKIPIDKYDYKLDFVLTEKQLYTYL